MGAALSLFKKWKEPIVPQDNESIDRAIHHILEQPQDMISSQEIYLALKIINLHLIKRMIASMNSQKELYINRVPLEMLHSGKFKSCLKKLFKHWLTMHTQINSKNILLIKSFDIQYLEVLAKFLLLMSENRTLRVMDNMKKYKLDEVTENLVHTKNIPQKNSTNMFPLENFIEMQSQTECEAAYITLRNTLNGFLKLKTSFLTRSNNTLEILSYMSEHTFVLLMRIYFHRQHHESVRNFVLKETPEEAVRFAAYFLARAVDMRREQLYDLTVRFLLSLIYDGQIKKQMPSFPSPLFPNISVMLENNLFQFILCNLFIGLSRQTIEVVEDDQILKKRVDRMQINRFETWRLIQFLLENNQAHMQRLSTYFLEELCLTVRITDIQRVYINKMIRFAQKVQVSDILDRFHKSEKVDYQLNFANRSLLLNETQISTYLADFMHNIPNTIDFYSERYLYGAIFQKRVESIWTQAALWNAIKSKLHTTHKQHHENGFKSSISHQQEQLSSRSLSHRQVEE